MTPASTFQRKVIKVKLALDNSLMSHLRINTLQLAISRTRSKQGEAESLMTSAAAEKRFLSWDRAIHMANELNFLENSRDISSKLIRKLQNIQIELEQANKTFQLGLASKIMKRAYSKDQREGRKLKVFEPRQDMEPREEFYRQMCPKVSN